MLNLDHYGRGYADLWFAELSPVYCAKGPTPTMPIAKFIARRVLLGVLTLL